MRQVLRFALAAVLTVCLLLCFAASADPLIPPENESELAEWLDSYPIDEMRALDTSAFLTFATDATDDSPATMAIVTGFVGEPSFIAVPATHDGVPVKAIAGGAFAGNESLRLAVIPSSVTAMGTGLFAGCPNLHTLSLPFVGGNAGDANGLAYFNVPSDGALLQVYLTDETAIAPSAFAGYTSLRKVVLPASGLVSIGTRAFGGCTGLKEIVVPNAESIAEGAFTGCAGLVSMTLPFVGGARGIDGDPSAMFGYIFGGNRYDGGTPVNQNWNGGNSADFYVPSGLRTVVFTDETVIPRGAFMNLSMLTSLSYSDTVTSFGISAFENCSGLSDIVIPAGVTAIPAYAFAGCTGLPANYAVPDGVKSIAQFAYRNCTSIATLTVPDSVESIAEGAFSGCSGITDITLPFVGGARGIDGDSSAVFGYIFGGNRYDGGTPVNQNYNGGNSRGTFIPANLTKVTITDESVIPYGAFDGMAQLTSLVYPDTVTSFGGRAFRGCSGLSDLPIPAGVTDIPYECFAGCTGLPADYAIPDGVKSIAQFAYRDCTSIKKLTVPDSVESIAEGAFNGCSGITDITLPFVGGARGVTGDSSAVFGYIFGGNRYDGGTPVTQNFNNSNSQGAYIPANLTKVTITDESVIPYGAFDGMAQLTSLVYPDTVTAFGGRAFRNCSGLSDLPIPAGVTDIPYECFADCTGLPADYAIPDGVKSIAQFAYRDCTSIEKLTVPDSVETIAEGAFNGCSGITDVTLPFVGGARGVTGDSSAVFGTIFGGNRYDGGTPVTQYFDGGNSRGTFIPANLTKVTITDESVIPYGAFDGMAQLVSLTYPDTVTAFGGRAFRNCSGLSDLPIPAGVTDIPYECFAGCTGLPADYVIPDGVKTVAQFAYRDCTGIKKLTVPDSVETIAEGAFSGCSGITDITLPFVGGERGNAGSREALFGYIFGALSYDGCVPVTAHYWGGTTQGYCLPEVLRSVTVTDESILARGAFENMTMLETVVLVNTVGSDLQQINANAFTGCSAEVVDLPAVNFLADDGETPQTIEGVNGVGKVDVTVWLAADLAERPTVITAFFDGDGRLLGADTQVVSAENDVWKFTAALPDGVTVACVKVITLDGNLAPLARPAVLR